jgi:hypothetical protein
VLKRPSKRMFGLLVELELEALEVVMFGEDDSAMLDADDADADDADDEADAGMFAALHFRGLGCTAVRL